jgi:FKBP-type peptidyl-prolyl cis-trans isomerase FkpA
MKKFIPLVLTAILFSCGGEAEEENTYVETEYDKEISKWLEDRDWEPTRSESGLYIYKEVPGSADKPALGSFLTLKYEGYLLDGTKFDGTNGEAVTFDFPVSGLIEGWQEAIPQFGKGGKGKLLIPPDLGYGDRPKGIIPANSILYFEMEILDWTNVPPVPVVPDYDSIIVAYMAEQDIQGAIRTESGLYMRIDDAGGVEKPTLNSYLTLEYHGFLLDGTQFDGTADGPTTFPFPTSNLIPGWQEAIPNLGKGGEAFLIIPPELGYGAQASERIPANSILVFDMKIHDFSDEPPAPEMPPQ